MVTFSRLLRLLRGPFSRYTQSATRYHLLATLYFHRPAGVAQRVGGSTPDARCFSYSHKKTVLFPYQLKLCSREAAKWKLKFYALKKSSKDRNSSYAHSR
jgi:hypothetical protein